jgi:hypothetical protein
MGPKVSPLSVLRRKRTSGTSSENPSCRRVRRCVPGPRGPPHRPETATCASLELLGVSLRFLRGPSSSTSPWEFLASTSLATSGLPATSRPASRQTPIAAARMGQGRELGNLLLRQGPHVALERLKFGRQTEAVRGVKLGLLPAARRGPLEPGRAGPGGLPPDCAPAGSTSRTPPAPPPRLTMRRGGVFHFQQSALRTRHESPPGR